jgi:hypothetical protein
MPFFDEELIFEGDTKTLGGVLQNFGNELQEKLRQSVRDNVSTSTSKNLEQSINFAVRLEGLGMWRFTLIMADYADFVDQGVRGAGGTKKSSSIFTKTKAGQQWRDKGGTSPFQFRKKKPPVDNRQDPKTWSIRRWAQVKGLNPYAVQETIFRQGIAPTRFYTDVVTEKLISGLATSLERAGARDIELSVTNILTGRAATV